MEMLETPWKMNYEVNGTNLAEIEGGEVATTNLLSCNGPEFVMQLSFHVKDSNGLKSEINFLRNKILLRGTCSPEGKECIEVILEKLEADGYGITENFETLSHVSVRRLGRLLPDAQTDAGFNRTLSKVDPPIPFVLATFSFTYLYISRTTLRTTIVWENQILKHQERTTPSSIDILDAEQCLELDIEGALPKDVDAGHEPPEEITAVVCPASFTSANASKNLDQEIHHERKFCDDSRDQI
uniref:Uncharacterized protein n=1 Tax=Solanum lycopersicum TaxID=4081 RepID=A0A3Q7FKL2_SOLLC